MQSIFRAMATGKSKAEFFVPSRCFASAKDRQRMILTGVGRDHPAVLRDVTEVITSNGGDVLTSRVQRLSGDTTIMMLIDISSSMVNQLKAELHEGEDRAGMNYFVKTTNQKHDDQDYEIYRIQVRGADHPGIIFKVSQLLSNARCDIDYLKTRSSLDDLSGENIFYLEGRVNIPNLVSKPALFDKFKEVEGSEDVTINLEPDQGMSEYYYTSSDEI